MIFLKPFKYIFSLGGALFIANSIGWIGLAIGVTMAITTSNMSAGLLVACITVLWAICLAAWTGLSALIIEENFNW